jgi:hypothetical protein
MRDYDVPFLLTHLMGLSAGWPHQGLDFWALWGASLPLLRTKKAKLGVPATILPACTSFDVAQKESRPKGGFRSIDGRGIDGLSARFALLHEGVLGGTGELLAVGANRLGFAAVMHALLHERGLGRARKRFTVLAHRLALAAFLRKYRSTRKCDDQTRQHDFSEHFFSPKK